MMPGEAGRTSLVLGAPRAVIGWTQLVRPSAPAAGQPFTRAIPGDTWERLYSIRFQLTSSVVVANRFAGINFLDQDNNIFLRASLSGAVAATSTWTANACVEGMPLNFTSAGDGSAPLPDLLLMPGSSWQIQVANFDVADQISNISALIQRYPAEHAWRDTEMLQAFIANE